MRLELSHVLLVMLLGAKATLAHAEWVLSYKGAAVAGQLVEIDALLANDSNAVMAEGMPDRIPIVIRSGAAPREAVLEAIKPSEVARAPLAAGAFRKQSYRLALPENLIGPITIELAQTPATKLVMIAERGSIGGPAVAAPSASVQPEAPSQASAPTADPNLDAAGAALSTNEPMYFIVGTRESTTAKFQLSFKYRLFDEKTWIGSAVPPLAKLYLGYTQTSIWDIGQDSAPFRDTSYRPSLFYLDPSVWKSDYRRQNLALRAGLEHESNGRDADTSRAINTVFVWPSYRFYVSDHYYVNFLPKFYRYLTRLGNEDISKYRGYADWTVRVGNLDGWLWGATLRHGSEHSAVQLDASYPIRQPFFANAGGYIYAQYFNGYGESLLDYNVKRRSQIRIGFAIVR